MSTALSTPLPTTRAGGKPEIEPEDDPRFADSVLDAKHIHIRGGLALKYPPREGRCSSTCGAFDYEVTNRGKQEDHHHPCLLALSHTGPCEFSSECQMMTEDIYAALRHRK